MILDTNAVSAWLDGDPDIENRLASAPLLVMPAGTMVKAVEAWKRRGGD